MGCISRSVGFTVEDSAVPDIISRRVEFSGAVIASAGTISFKVADIAGGVEPAAAAAGA